MNKLKIFAILNLIVFGAFTLTEIYHFCFEYENLRNVLSEIYPCKLYYRIPIYSLTLLILIASIRIVIQKKMYYKILVISCIGFLSYEIVAFALLFFDNLGYYCHMSALEYYPVIYLFVLVELISIVRIKKGFTKVISVLKVFFLFVLFILLFFIYRYVFVKLGIYC
jgi:hypothetical protein